MSRRPPTVLVVDDDRSLRRALDGFLRRHGFPVVTASSGAEALLAVAREQPDILLCELGIDDPEGTEGTEVIRSARRERPGVRCILMSRDDPSVAARVVGSACLRKGPTFLPELRDILDITEP